MIKANIYNVEMDTQLINSSFQTVNLKIVTHPNILELLFNQNIPIKKSFQLNISLN